MSSHQIPSEKARFAGLPRLVVRDRESRGQMLMFSVISVAAVAMMTFVPSPRAAFGAVEAPGKPAIEAASAKAGRLGVPTMADRACAGQSWGAETLDCILAIASDGGVSRPVRLADAGSRR